MFFCDSAMHAEIKGCDLFPQTVNKLLVHGTFAYGNVDQAAKQSFDVCQLIFNVPTAT